MLSKSALSAFALLIAFSATSCGDQAEGERCERTNDDNDCGPGLVCTSLQNLTGASAGAVCCPQSNAQTAICQRAPFDLGGNGETPAAPTPSNPDTAADAGG